MDVHGLVQEMGVHGPLNLTQLVLIPVLWTLFIFKFCYINFRNLNKIENVKPGGNIIELACVVQINTCIFR